MSGLVAGGHVELPGLLSICRRAVQANRRSDPGKQTSGPVGIKPYAQVCPGEPWESTFTSDDIFNAVHAFEVMKR